MAIRLSWSREPYSRWSTLSCLPASIHIFEIWPSKVSLSSISIPNAFIVSEDSREIFSTVTFHWIPLILLLFKNMVWNLAGFAAQEFSWTIPLKKHFFMQRICDDINRTTFKWYAVVTVEQKWIINKTIKQQQTHYWSLSYTSLTNHLFCHVFWPCDGGYGDNSR